MEVSERDENVDQMDVDSSSRNGLGRRPNGPETDIRARLKVGLKISSNDLVNMFWKVISKRNIRFRTGTPVHEMVSALALNLSFN